MDDEEHLKFLSRGRGGHSILLLHMPAGLVEEVAISPDTVLEISRVETRYSIRDEVQLAAPISPSNVWRHYKILGVASKVQIGTRGA